MSYSQAVNKAINQAVKNFVDAVATKYNLSASDLMKIWNDGQVESDQVVSTAAAASVSVSAPVAPVIGNLPSSGELNKLGKNELVAHCKARGIKTTGNKQELIARLTGENPSATTSEAKSSSTTAKSTSKAKKAEEVPKVVNQIQSTLQPSLVKKNSFGNYEHVETTFVFDNVTRKVIGKQNKNGKIDSLDDADIELCHKYKFKYNLPENLNANSKATTVAIEGIEDEEVVTERTDIINEAEELIEEEEEMEEEVEEVFEDE